jgi:hypothetical protein
MAYDKILAIHGRLDKRITYALNEAKSTSGGKLLQTAISCQLDTACRDMLSTKRRWDKESGVQGYHLIHSYAPGEVTAEQAQALSVEFAQRLLQGRFEAVVSTHLDHEHIHSHIIINSVSCTDGKKFRSDFNAYFGDIREISNAVSREHGLSVIEPKGKGKQYAEWSADKKGKPTVRGLIRKDIDRAMNSAISMQTFLFALQKQGYTIKRGKYIAVRPPGGERFIRLNSLGTGYTGADIKSRIYKDRTQKSVKFNYAKKRYRPKSRTSYAKSKGLRRLYLHYLFLLAPPKRCKPKNTPFNVRSEVRRLNQYKGQFALLQKYRIENESQLSMLASALQADIDSLVFARRDLYRRKRNGEEVVNEIEQINVALRPIRRELRCCQRIEVNTPQIREQLEQARQAQKSKEKEVKQYGSERRSR